MIIFDGKKTTITELSKKSGLAYKTLHARIYRYKWDINIAVNTPLTTSRAYKKILKRNAITI